MLTTLIFDLDDTLYDEINYCKSGFRKAAEFIRQNRNCPPTIETNDIFRMLWGEFTSGNTTKTFNAVLKKLEVPCDKEFISQIVKKYRQHFPDIHLPTESREFLENHKDKYNLALLTDGFLPAQEYKVQALGVEQFFEEIIYTEKLGREYWKPSSLGFEKILEKSNTPPARAAYIADNEEKDFIAPNKLGMKTIKILRKNRIHKSPPPVPQAKAQNSVNDLAELTRLLEKI